MLVLSLFLQMNKLSSQEMEMCSNSNSMGSVRIQSGLETRSQVILFLLGG